jgi:large subunit ribosomal protein L9
MKVIFIENHEDHKVGDVREMADGYVRNFLLPRGIAKVATPEEIKNLESKIKKLQTEEEKHVNDAQKIADKISAQALVLSEEVNEDGHLYGAVTPKEIAEALAEKGFEIDGSDVVMEDSIHDMGEYTVTIRVGHGVETELKVKVERSK